jgi:hypothetical protein
LWPLGICCGIWYIFPCFGMLYHEKSGNLVVMAVCSNSRRNYLKNSRRWVRVPPGCAYGRFKQVCQIILGKTYQNGKNIPNHHKIHHIALQYTKGQYVKYFKWQQNIPTSSIPRPSKIYPNLDFWFENMPSGNHGSKGPYSWTYWIDVFSNAIRIVILC